MTTWVRKTHLDSFKNSLNRCAAVSMDKNLSVKKKKNLQKRGTSQFSRCLCAWLQLFVSFPSHSSQRWDCHFLFAQYQSLPHTISPVTPGGWCSNASAPCTFSSQKRLKTLMPNLVCMCVHPHYLCPFVIICSIGPPFPRNRANNIVDYKGKDIFTFKLKLSG